MVLTLSNITQLPRDRFINGLLAPKPGEIINPADSTI